jgi:hypothetical protein
VPAGCPPCHDPGAGRTAAADALFGVLHALYWLVVNLSDDAPVVLLVDDLQCGRRTLPGSSSPFAVLGWRTCRSPWW